MQRRLAALLFSCFAAATATAAPPYQRPAGIADDKEPLIAAGYRALFTCSAHFHAGRRASDIHELELADTAALDYPDPYIDLRQRTVTATDRARTVERIAVYRESMGCTLLPPHWTLADAPRLPYVPLPPAPDLRQEPFPVGDATDLPADGLDPAHRALGPVLDRAFDGKSYGTAQGVATTAVLVIRNGRLVAERYLPGFGIHTGYRTWSTAKTMTAVLFGIAVEKGLVRLKDRPAIPEWSYPGDPRQAITYRDLLWMSSGLMSGGSNTNAIYFGGQDMESAAATTPLEVAPGTRWKYANNDTLLLMRALRAILNDDWRYLRFPYDELFHPLGMWHTRMETDHLGRFIGSSQVYTTARDLARFGLFLAAGGAWPTRGQMTTPGWVRFLATPAPTKPPVDGEWGYGAQLWLLDRMPGVPPGTYTTAGNKGQYVTVVPGRDLVIVRTGVDPDGKRFHQDRLVADVVKALAP